MLYALLPRAIRLVVGACCPSASPASLDMNVSWPPAAQGAPRFSARQAAAPAPPLPSLPKSHASPAGLAGRREPLPPHPRRQNRQSASLAPCGAPCSAPSPPRKSRVLGWSVMVRPERRGKRAAAPVSPREGPAKGPRAECRGAYRRDGMQVKPWLDRETAASCAKTSRTAVATTAEAGVRRAVGRQSPDNCGPARRRLRRRRAYSSPPRRLWCEKRDMRLWPDRYATSSPRRCRLVCRCSAGRPWRASWSARRRGP